MNWLQLAAVLCGVMGIVQLVRGIPAKNWFDTLVGGFMLFVSICALTGWLD